ncbi:MAG: NFACT family protein [Candidatus Marinimicrobia bacterium]|nr:NFACT family protein [Candidatus Neomarinimicrobiota bacterium]MCF7829686.1 NFACT family protein [Candidatus Neomarinimicrobiota bacterium]MCF7881636.1 NFACT family protein [Candidatus Neomarinimicrobiota bacterium]
MHNHWFTLNSYWTAQADRITGAKISQAFTYEKNQCSFILLKDRDQYRVDYSGIAELPYLVVKDQLNIPRRKVGLFESMGARTIENISMIPADRILKWELDDGSLLCFEFFGGSPNIYHVDENRTILDSFKDVENTILAEFRDFSGIPYPLPGDFHEDFESSLSGMQEKSIKNALTEVLPHWTADLARETVHRASLSLQMQVKDIPEENIGNLSRAVVQMLREVEQKKAFISRLPEPQFSPLELKHQTETEWDMETPISEGYPRYIGVYYRGKKYRDLHRRLRTSLGNKIERLQRRIEKQKGDLDDWKSAEVYRKYGDLLMANMHQIERGQQSVTLDDIIGDAGQVTIDLQPDISVVENAQAYYEKAKKTSRGREALQKQIAQTEKELATLNDLYDRLEQAESLSMIDEIADELAGYGISTSQQQTQETSERKPYTEYTSPDGWRILVGRKSRDNDELTFHIAHKEDFWFHAENVPGSHVIAISDNKRVDSPPKPTIEYAAGLAAGHSQAQHSGLVPVVYTKRKYVTKPRDAGPGLVRYEFEESVMVEPRKS